MPGPAVHDVARADEHADHHVEDPTGQSDVETAGVKYGPAVASTAMATACLGPQRPWRVLGMSTHVWWCSADDAVLVITDDRVVRLPNAVIVHPGHTLPTRLLPPGDYILVGDGAVATRTAAWRVVRWWEAKVAPVRADPGDVTGRARAAADLLSIHSPIDGEAPVTAALRRGDGDRVVAEAGRLIGRGVGLTPEGDDVLSGVVAGYRHIGASIGNPAVSTVLDRVGPSVLAVARKSTTMLSFSLLHHAFAGEVAAPVGQLLRALTGRGDLAAAVEATVAIGHRSGPALARGVVAGVVAGCGDRL